MNQALLIACLCSLLQSKYARIMRLLLCLDPFLLLTEAVHIRYIFIYNVYLFGGGVDDK